MLKGIDPVIVVNLKTAVTQDASLTSILKDTKEQFLDLNVIPIYLSEKITGLIVESEDKNIVASTDTETLDSGEVVVKSKTLGSTVSVHLLGEENSIGIVLMSSIMDVLYRRLTKNDYSIHYVNKGVSIFNATLSSFSVSRDSNSTQFRIVIELNAASVDGLIEKKEAGIEVTNAVPKSELTAGGGF